MGAGVLNILIEQGATFSRTVVLKDGADQPINLTGAQVRGHLRTSYDAQAFVAFTMAINAPATNGSISWELPVVDSRKLSAGSWVYDIEVEYAGGTVDRVLQGTATVSPEVTR